MDDGVAGSEDARRAGGRNHGTLLSIVSTVIPRTTHPCEANVEKPASLTLGHLPPARSGLSVTTYGIYSTWCEGTVTDGEQTMLVNGLSECPSSTTAFAFGPNTPVDLTWVNVDSTRVTASGVAVFTVSAEQVALLYRSSDLASVVATRSSVTASASSTGRASDTGIGGGGGGGGGSQGNGISNGSIAGIAIGAAAVGIAAVLGAVYLVSRHRRGKRTARFREKELDAAGGRPPTGPGAGYHASQPRTMPANDSRQPSSPKRQYELNASASESSRVSPVIAERPVQSSSVVELYGSTLGREQPFTVSSSQGNGETLRHNYQGVVESGGIYEVSATGHGYQQLPISPARKHMDESRQNTPVDLIRRGDGS